MITELLQKIFGGYLEKKAELYEGTPTEGKVWYKSKAVIAGLVVVLRGLYEGISAVMVSAGKPALPPIPGYVDSILGVILGGAAIQGRVNGSEPIKISQDVTPTDQHP